MSENPGIPEVQAETTSVFRAEGNGIRRGKFPHRHQRR